MHLVPGHDRSRRSRPLRPRESALWHMRWRQAVLQSAVTQRAAFGSYSVCIHHPNGGDVNRALSIPLLPQCAGGFACLDCNDDYRKCTRCGMAGFQYLAANHTCQWVSLSSAAVPPQTSGERAAEQLVAEQDVAHGSSASTSFQTRHPHPRICATFSPACSPVHRLLRPLHHREGLQP